MRRLAATHARERRHRCAARGRGRAAGEPDYHLSLRHRRPAANPRRNGMRSRRRYEPRWTHALNLWTVARASRTGRGMTGQVGALPLEPIREGKYARIERERRFLLADPPPSAAVTGRHRITDRYLPGTRLRLRRI